jgi:1-acyl-sn-glycerol-3-phosphate acyltransferase
MDWFEQGYVPFILRRRFDQVIFHGDTTGEKSSVLMLSNHIGWWEPFFMMAANRKFFKKRYHVMMLEEELRKRPLLRQAGAFSVKKKSREVMESLHYTVDLLNNSLNLVQLFPQGNIESPFVERIVFESGINFIARRAPSAAVWFQCNFIEYFSRSKPEAHVFFRRAVSSALTLEENFNHFYRECRNHLVALHKNH